MGSFRVLKTSAKNKTAPILLTFMAIVLAFVPSIALAAEVEERSVTLSSSSKSATGVTYTVSFKAVQAAGAFLIDFCSNSPVLGQSCTPPTGFNATSAASTSSGFTDVTGSTSKVIVADAITANQVVTVAITGITNPSTTDPLYARIVTFAAEGDATTYTSTAPGANVRDNGGVAIAITDTIGVSGAVLESMTFCVAGASITADCGNASANPPTVQLGETVGTTKALTASAISTGDIFAQISTNAVSGAIVNLKNGVTCGGLQRTGASTCDILPVLTGTFNAGDAKFGVLASSIADTGTSPSGVFQAINGYNDTTYVLNHVVGNATGVSSAYGDQILDTAGEPANNKNMKLTFGASVSNSTPAGNYSANLSLVATGKF